MPFFKAAAYACLLFASVCVGGCRSHVSPTEARIDIQAHVPLGAYVRLALGENGQPDKRRYFPLLQIYNADGALIYTGHNAPQNAALLKALPGSLSTMKPISGSIPLPVAASEIAEFGGSSGAILNSRKPTILMVLLQDFHACSVQEHAVEEDDSGLRQAGFNSLTLHVER